MIICSHFVPSLKFFEIRKHYIILIIKKTGQQETNTQKTLNNNFILQKHFKTVITPTLTQIQGKTNDKH